MYYRFLLALLGLGMLAGRASAQTSGFVYGSVAKIVQGTDTLSQAWAGGLNTPLFSSIDLNGDGQADLYAFDRETTRSYAFLSVVNATTAGRHYEYAPDYARIFPANLERWVLLRDYDCDGRPDLFTSEGNGASSVRVFRNVPGPGGVPSFVLANNQLLFPYGGSNVNVSVGYYNVPTIQDVNGDGRLDILTYESNSSVNLQLYLNTSTGNCGGVSSFAFTTNYWGQITSCFTDCAAFQFQANGTNTTCQPYKITHSQGHSALLIDLNGDGKLDLLDGRDNCPQLTRLLNSGADNVNASFVPANVSSDFPTAAAPLRLGVFPTPFSLDATFDGVPDLVVTAAMTDNTQDRVSMRHNVQLYRNTAASASAVPNYSLLTDSFLQSDMLDVSEGAAPTFGDVDGDGLVDMLVGNQGDLVNGYYRASLHYYRNVGTAHRPVFRLVSDDYLGLAAKAALTPGINLESLHPQLVDINRDGALDLVYSAYLYDPTAPGGLIGSGSNFIYYILNTAAANRPLALDPTKASYFKSPGTTDTGQRPDFQHFAPFLYDVDNDGYVDMLLGTNTSNPTGYGLRYFRNQGPGSSLDYAFVQISTDYGALRSGMTYNNGRPANLTPLVADLDQDGAPDLLTVDGAGTVRLYSNFRAQSASFVEVNQSNLFYNRLSQQFEPARLAGGNPYSLLRFVPAAADLNQDGQPELYLGTETGGIVSYLRATNVTLASQAVSAAALALGLYPNPASNSTTVETAQPTRVQLLDVTGRLVSQDATLARRHTLGLQGLAAGIYLVQATAADGTRATQRLAVQ